MEQDSEVFDKYNGKRIRVSGRLYTIESGINFGRVVVRLEPLRTGMYPPSSEISYSYPRYYESSEKFQKAVDKAHELAEEIEASLKADFEEDD